MDYYDLFYFLQNGENHFATYEGTYGRYQTVCYNIWRFVNGKKKFETNLSSAKTTRRFGEIKFYCHEPSLFEVFSYLSENGGAYPDILQNLTSDCHESDGKVPRAISVPRDKDRGTMLERLVECGKKLILAESYALFEATWGFCFSTATSWIAEPKNFDMKSKKDKSDFWSMGFGRSATLMAEYEKGRRKLWRNSRCNMSRNWQVSNL